MLDNLEEYKTLETIRTKLGYKFDRANLIDTQNRCRTVSLFYELSYDKPDFALFSTAQEHHKDGYLSLYKMIIELDDPSEYLPAMVLFGSWDHWLRIKNSPVIGKIIEYATNEVEVREYSRAVQRIKEIASGTGKDALQAAKYLASKQHKSNMEAIQKKARSDDKKPVGRPIKDKTDEKEIIAKIRQANVESDYDRIIGEFGKTEE